MKNLLRYIPHALWLMAATIVAYIIGAHLIPLIPDYIEQEIAIWSGWISVMAMIYCLLLLTLKDNISISNAVGMLAKKMILCGITALLLMYIAYLFGYETLHPYISCMGFDIGTDITVIGATILMVC